MVRIWGGFGGGCGRKGVVRSFSQARNGIECSVVGSSLGGDMEVKEMGERA